jgi:hypothetical protein
VPLNVQLLLDVVQIRGWVNVVEDDGEAPVLPGFIGANFSVFSY